MSINPAKFYDQLRKQQIEFFTGVPDSLLKQFCLCVDENVDRANHLIAANEGNAIACAAGYHLATGKVPLVYMQNSGLGNAINPLLSLCDPDVYSIPEILLIGWRGEPNRPDEPQHVKQGKVQLELMKTLNIPYEVLSADDEDYESKVSGMINLAQKQKCPVAIIVKKGTFEAYSTQPSKLPSTRMSREESLDLILDHLSDDTVIVSTTGKTSREIFEIRDRRDQSHAKDFLTVGSMGHCSSIALGICIAKPERNVVCIDGDGALIMHMGSLSSVGKVLPKNFTHILINNEAHESVGGQATSARFINIRKIVEANGYANVAVAKNGEMLATILKSFENLSGPNFIEVKVKLGSRDDLGRPTRTPKNNKADFMQFLGVLD